MALRLRRSTYIDQYLADQTSETELLESALDDLIPVKGAGEAEGDQEEQES
jgi:hypothetical protein